MASILNNPSAITALQSLRATQNALSVAQKQVSTGYKIGGAEDNASTWSIAEAMKSDKAALSTISDALSESSSILNVANAAVKSAISVMNDIKSALVQAQQPGADTSKILTSLQQLGQQLTSVVSSATFTGMNVLDGSETGSVSFVASYNNGGGGAASTVGTIDLNITDLTNAASGGILEAAQATGATAATDFTALVSGDLAAATIFDPESKVERSVRTVKENSQSQNNASNANTTVERNIPQAGQNNNDGRQSSDQNRKSEDAMRQSFALSLCGETGDGDRALGDGVDLSVDAGERGEHKRAAHQRCGVAH